MPKYEIWVEGFIATGDRSSAARLGSAEGETFKDACIELAKHSKVFKDYFDLETMRHWGCRLFDNEVDARKSFG